MNKNLAFVVALATANLLLAGCSAIEATPAGAAVELVNDRPQGKCKALGETVGSQGNWFTGDYTSNKNLMIGARNDLRNQAAAMGGNIVHVQNLSNTNSHVGLGTTNTTVVGMVYNCQR
jgi:starvation-inducible outer membrane lipoprotein